MIVDANSARVQRQLGDFHGLREKVMQLHSEFERVRRAALPAPPTPAAPAGSSTPATALVLQQPAGRPPASLEIVSIRELLTSLSTPAAISLAL